MQALLAQGLPVRRVLQALLLQGLLAPRLLVALTLQPELGHLLASARSPTKEAEQLGPELRLELLGVLPVQQSQWSQQAPQEPPYEAKPYHVPSFPAPAAP